MDFRIIPYIEIDGIRTFTNSEIMGMFDQMVKDQTDRATFYQGDVKTREEFLRMARSPSNHFYVMLAGADVVGVFWLNTFRDRSVQVHFCIFSPYWGHADEAFQAGHKALCRMKDEKGDPLFTRYIGIIPAWNKRVTDLMVRAGGTIVGTVPDLCWDDKNNRSVEGVISYL